MKNYVSLKLFHGIHDFNGHGVNNIIIYNMASHNFPFVFKISLILLEFMNQFYD